jgi:hypothetical protein
MVIVPSLGNMVIMNGLAFAPTDRLLAASNDDEELWNVSGHMSDCLPCRVSEQTLNQHTDLVDLF